LIESSKIPPSVKDEILMEARMTSMHYDETYFAYQKTVGEFGAWANLPKFENFVKPTDHVVDFGCGGGYQLAALTCADRIGIEPNAAAWPEGERIGVSIVGSPADVPDQWADVIISNNALEHCRHPLLELEALLPKVRPGGQLVFVAPCESIRLKYNPDLLGHHLYGWSPMAMGNLFTEAGFVVEESKPYIHKWPTPLPYESIARVGGRRIFNAMCRIYGHIDRQWFQVRVVARRPHRA
jgi:SAM-dependent methyltransferase